MIFFWGGPGGEDRWKVSSPELGEELKKLIVVPEALGEAHLGQLSAGLLEFPADDKRREVAAILLSRALSIHQVATALTASDTFDLVCVRYDALDAFFGAFIDQWPKAAAYVTPEDARRVATVLPEVMELHDAFLARLIELMKPTVTIVASEHGYWEEPWGGAAKKIGPMRAYVARDYHRPGGWAICDKGEPEKKGASGRIVELAGSIGGTLGIEKGEIGTRLPRVNGGVKVEEKGVDDLLELGIAKLGDIENAAREELILEELRVGAMHCRASGNLEEAAKLFEALVARRFDFADGMRLIQTRLELGRYADARAMSEKMMLLSPGNLVVLIAHAHSLFGTGDRAGGVRMYNRARALNENDPRVEQLRRAWQIRTEETAKENSGEETDEVREKEYYFLYQPRELYERLEGMLSDERRLIDAANERIVQLAKRLSWGTDVAANRPERFGTEAQRLRATGSGGVQRHWDIEEAAGFEGATKYVFRGWDGARPATLMERAMGLHSRIFGTGTNWRREAVAVEGGVGLDGKASEVHVFPDAGKILPVMEEMGAGLERVIAWGIHPALIAAATWVDLCTIHPFKDGNGRTSRLLAQDILLTSGYRGVAWVNVERRLDRRQAEYEAMFSTRGQTLIRFLVSFFAEAFADSAARMERVVAGGAEAVVE